MRGKERQISLLVALCILVGGIVWGMLDQQSYHFPAVAQPSTVATTDLSHKAIQAKRDFNPNIKASTIGWTNYRDKKLLVDQTFTTFLPLVVIDTKGQQPKRGVIWDKEKEYYVSTGEDPYAYGEISVIDNQSGVNSPEDLAATHSRCKLKVRGNSSGNYDKQQYLIKLMGENGKPQNHNILGMGSDSEWILNVSFIDKSLMRNYLAYTTAGQIMPYTPDAQFCEVLWKDEDGYRYEGVYMMMESIKVSENRVDLPQYSDNAGSVPALLRRDRYNVNGIMLENYSTQNKLTSGYLDVEYPDKKVVTKKGVDTITEQVNRFERALYADTWEEFVQYRKFVNMDSFVDYFVLNEFFLNYDAGYNSTYIYMDYSGKLNMGPVWDFDQAMDNNATITANLSTTAFHSAPWFDRMLQDPVFTDHIVKRYGELRKSILSDESIQRFVTQTVSYLEPAIQRDWARWGYYYTDGGYLQPEFVGQANRNTQSHQQEVDKILRVLSEHGAWMDEHLDSLYQFKTISLEDAQQEQNSHTKDNRQALAVAFVVVFLVSIHLVLKYESE